jgi:hypothetical protein
MLSAILPLLAATATLSLIDNNAVEGAVVGIFGPYTQPPGETASWDYPIYSADLTSLIAEWRRVTPEGEVDALSDGDWLCQCQDWDAQAFTATMGTKRVVDEDTVEVDVAVDLGFGGPEAIRQERLTLKREDGVWKLDDMTAEAFPNGLRQALRETIAEDKAAAGERG